LSRSASQRAIAAIAAAGAPCGAGCLTYSPPAAGGVA
jgi:hypothetical protein